MASPLSASDRSAGPILAAHPQVRDMPIRVFFLRKNMAPTFQRLAALADRNASRHKSVMIFIAVKPPTDQINPVKKDGAGKKLPAPSF
jgi:hypothetical protein